MRTRIVSTSVVVALALLQAEPAGAWCVGREGKPECYSSPGVGMPAAVVHQRINNICNISSPDAYKVDVEVMYPDPLYVTPGTKLTPVLFLHGGGMANSFCDKHTTDTSFPYDCSPSFHYSNPFGYLGEHLAHKGAAVMFPIMQIDNNSLPYNDADLLQNVITCLSDRTTTHPDVGTGCGDEGEPLCITDLQDHLAWTHNDRPGLVAIGYSAGAVAGLYLPERLRSALRAVIMIDPAKEEYTMMPPVPTMYGTPVLHLYPDWYGPHRNHMCSAPINPARCQVDGDCPAGQACTGGNNLFTLSGLTGGAWVPMGIRETGTFCDPDTGCHTATHCMPMLSTEYSWVNGMDQPGHANYCDPGTTTCTGMQQDTGCEGSATECSRFAKCAANPAIEPSGHDWFQGGATHIAYRYTIAWTACVGARFGSSYQSWVNGADRSFDDSGTNGSLCTLAGQPNSACAVHSTASACQAAGCHWAQGVDGKAIRINNGQRVTEYDHNPFRYYSASHELYNKTGVCEGGTRNGQACSTDAFCLGANCSAGDFTERNEDLVLTPGPGYLSCSTGLPLP